MKPSPESSPVGRGLLIYQEMGPQLSEAVKKGYRGGLAAMVKLNKKKILRLADPSTPLRFAQDDKPPLFKISYTGTDEQLLRNFEIEALTVAGVLNYECEEKLKAMAKSLIDGTHPYLKSHPESSIEELWRDEAYNILGDYIEVPTEPHPGPLLKGEGSSMPPPSYLQTNLQTAVNSSYHAAQWQRLQGMKDVYPAYQYKTREDDRVREEHAALDNLVAQADDPIWNKIWPPNGWNCRCYVNPLGDGELSQVNPADRLHLTDMEKRDSLLKDANVPTEFQRNSGESGSIWGKWLQTKFEDVDYYQKFKEVFDYSRSVGRYQEKGLIDSILDSNKSDFIDRDLSEASWNEEFPNNETDTPIGKAKLSYDQLEKLLTKEDDRSKFFGLIKPTLNDPAMIIKDDRGGLVFVRQFQGKTEKVFAGIGYRDGDVIKMVSLTPRQLRDIVVKLEKGEVLHFSASALSESADSVRKHSAIRGGVLKFTDNIPESDANVNETWGEFISPGKTAVRNIAYKMDGFRWRKDDGTWKDDTYENIGKYRKGVLMNV
jgi:SPP1 gp7 family putative phage head morphogenesis protein